MRIDTAKEVLRTETGSKLADSKMILFVLISTSALLPPLTPANAKIPTSSAMTRYLSFIATSLPSNVVMVSPIFAKRTTIGPLTLSASKACKG